MTHAQPKNFAENSKVVSYARKNRAKLKMNQFFKIHYIFSDFFKKIYLFGKRLFQKCSAP